MIAIIIPFFQNDPGLLKRALLSVFRQNGTLPIRVYIVDDSSPVSLNSELADLPVELREKIVVLHQQNSGPGAARNLALSSLHDDVGIITFLDSDDVWDERHLANVSAAFGNGAEFYFADYIRAGAALTCFGRRNFVPGGASIVGSNQEVFWCDAAMAFDKLLTISPVGTPTVAYRRDLFGELRFDTRFRAVGEDTLLWADILSRNPQTAVSMRTELYCGHGVNVSSFQSWGEERMFRSLHDTVRYQTYLKRRFVFSGDQLEESARLCRAYDFDLWASVFAMARRGNNIPIGLILSYVLDRPVAALRLPVALVAAITRKLGKQA